MILPDVNVDDKLNCVGRVVASGWRLRTRAQTGIDAGGGAAAETLWGGRNRRWIGRGGASVVVPWSVSRNKVWFRYWGRTCFDTRKCRPTMRPGDAIVGQDYKRGC